MAQQFRCIIQEISPVIGAGASGKNNKQPRLEIEKHVTGNIKLIK